MLNQRANRLKSKKDSLKLFEEFAKVGIKLINFKTSDIKKFIDYGRKY